MDSSIGLRRKMISVYLNLVFYVFLFIKISSICPAAANNDPKYTQDVLLSENGYFNSTQNAGFRKKEELKSSLGTRCPPFKKLALTEPSYPSYKTHSHVRTLMSK